MDPEKVNNDLHARTATARQRAKTLRTEMIVAAIIWFALLLLATNALVLPWYWGVMLGFSSGATVAAAYFSGAADGRLDMAQRIHRHDHEGN